MYPSHRKDSSQSYLETTHVIIGLISSIVLLLFCYIQILYRMGRDWAVDPNYSHGFIIPFISGYLVWKRKDLLTTTAVHPSGWGLPVLLGGLFLLVVGKAGSEFFTMRFSFFIAEVIELPFCRRVAIWSAALRIADGPRLACCSNTRWAVTPAFNP